MTGRAFLDSRNERSANLLVSSDGHLRVADDGPGLRATAGLVADAIGHRTDLPANGSSKRTLARLNRRTLAATSDSADGPPLGTVIGLADLVRARGRMRPGAVVSGGAADLFESAGCDWRHAAVGHGQTWLYL
jgi:hypothetical protein